MSFKAYCFWVNLFAAIAWAFSTLAIFFAFHVVDWLQEALVSFLALVVWRGLAACWLLSMKREVQ